MNTLGPKNIAKKILSYIDPFDNCGMDVMRQLEADTCNQCLHRWHQSMFPIISEIVCYANVFKERCCPLSDHTLLQYH